MLLAGLVHQEPAPAPTAPTRPAKPTQAASPRPPARSGIPEDLPTQREVLLPAEVQAHPEAFRQIDELVTRELDYEPGRFFWHLYVRPKFVRQNASPVSATPVAPSPTAQPGAVATQLSPVMLAMVAAEIPALKEVLVAALPNRLIEKGLPGVGLLVHLLLSRFEDHLPFYRQEKIFRERHRIPISRQSMVEWAEQIATWLQPVYRQMIKDLVAQKYLQADETPIGYLDREVPGRACQGYFWGYGRPGGDVIFDWQTGRSREGPRAILKEFKGKLQTDGYGVYQSLAGERKEDWMLIGCWAHARRKFFDAKDHDRRAGWFLKQIALLYGLESRLRRQRAGPALRQAARAAEAKMILGRMGRALNRLQSKVLPQSLLGKAIRYTVKLWTELNRYVEFGEVEIDNNLIENAIRPTAIGKKNFRFIGHPDAGWRSAISYSILGSCRRHGINPASYLSDVLKRLPDMKQSEIPTITPGAWAKAHPEARVLPPQ
jgi:transposase